MFRVINRLRLFDDQCDAENKDRDPGFRGKDYEDIRWDFIGKTTKIIQVPMKETLLKQIDVTAGVVSESRSAFIREACQQRLKSLRAKELDRLYIEGHQSHPEDLDWAKSSATLLSKRLPKEKW